MSLKAVQDAPMMEFTIDDGVKVHNTELEADGTFRRFITSAKGVEVTLDSAFPFDQIATLGKLLDEVAEANFEAGKRAAQQVLREALGFPKDLRFG